MFTNLYMAVATSIPNPSPEAPPELEGKVSTILGLGMWLVMVACVAGVLICAGKMALAYRRGELAESFGSLAGVGVACILGASASGFVNFLML